MRGDIWTAPPPMGWPVSQTTEFGPINSLFAFNEGAGAPTEAVRGIHPVSYGSIGTWSSNQGYSPAASSYFTYGPYVPAAATASFTLWVYGRFILPPGKQNYLISTASNGSGVTLVITAAGLQLLYGNMGMYSPSSPIKPAANTLSFCAIAISAPSRSVTYYMYAPATGAEVVENGSSGTPLTDAGNVCLFNDELNTSYPVMGGQWFRQAGLSLKSWGLPQLRSMARNPWQIFQPRRSWWDFGRASSPSASPSPSLLMQGF